MSKAAIRAHEVPARSTTIYPKEFAGALKGREKRALGDFFELTRLGVNLTVLPPGAWSSQRHWHEREDEFIYVLDGEIVLADGEIVLADGEGEHVLTAGMCAGFKAASGNGHCLKNKSARTATYLEIGTRDESERIHYPDVDMKGEKVGGKWVLTRKDGSAF